MSTEQEQVAIELVKRSRLGDQNATATIIETRKAAERGSPKAQRSMAIMLAYVKGGAMPAKSMKRLEAHGVFSSALAALRDLVRRCRTPQQHAALTKNVVPQVGTSLQDAANAAQAISQGPRVGNDVMRMVQATFGAEGAQRAFGHAARALQAKPVIDVAKKADPETKRALQLGYTLGLARRLQAARAGNVAAYSKVAAWELGF